MGHEISPGASFCSQGHPMALDQMQFSSEAYARQGALGAPPPAAYGQSAATSAPAAPYGTPPPPPFASLPGFGGPALPPYGSNDPTRDPVPPKVLRGFLLAYSTNPSGDFWPLTGGRLLVGRFGSAEGIDIALQDPTISSRHAAIWVDAANGVISVEDTASTNGTFVNDEHIGFNGRRELRDGDRVRFGAYKTIVKVIGRM
jgi:cold shock CspA family protein